MDKKQKTIIFIMLIIALIIIISVVSYIINSNTLNKYTSSEISFSYDNNWSVSKHDDNIYLVDKLGSRVVITITDIDDTTENMTIDQINSGVISKLMSDNKDYKKIVDQKMKITSIYYDGYKTLLEDNNHQALVFVCSTSNYILTVNYIAENQYFDMSLDSVENIVGTIAI